MTRSKSRWAMFVICALASFAAALPASALAQGVDEYSLNLPDGGGSQQDAEPGGSEPSPEPAAEPQEVAPVAPAPVTPAPPLTPTLAAPAEPGGPKRPQKEPSEPLFGTSSPNATLGPQRLPRLRIRESAESTPVVPIGAAVLAALCCVAAIWRLRLLREIPSTPHSGAAA